MQLLPSPEYPGLQVQLWEPSVLLQKALMSQLWLLLVHSSISLKKNPQSEKISTFNHHLHKGTRSTHTKKKTKDTKKPSFICRFDLHYNIKPSVYFSHIYEETKNKNMLLPVQLLPSPVYPGLQVQLWDPSVLLHTALMSQLWVLIIHSSVSRKESAQRSQKYNIYFTVSQRRYKVETENKEQVCSQRSQKLGFD